MTKEEKKVLADQIRQTVSTLNTQLTAAHYVELAVEIQSIHHGSQIVFTGIGLPPHLDVTIKEAQIAQY